MSTLNMVWTRAQAAAVLRVRSVLARRRGVISRQRSGVSRPVLVILVLVIGVAGLLPLFKWNLFSTADTAFFDGWDRFSESLVLAKIESTTPLAGAQGTERAGLLLAGPNAGVVYESFNGLREGHAPLADQYDAYISNPGLQGFLFLGAYRAGCNTVGCLETLNSGFTAIAIVGFAILLCSIAPRSFGAVFLLVAASSPWIVASARNLYWMPSSWFLPAIAAICFVTASTRRRRVISAAAVFACFALRFGMGFEYITTVTLLAMAMPVIARVFGRVPHQRWKGSLRDLVLVGVLAISAFIVILVALIFDVGNGDWSNGVDYVISDATKRTSGAGSDDPGTVLARSASPVSVLLRYVIGWNTNVVVFGVGTPMQLVFGPQSLWLLMLLAVTVVMVRVARRDPASHRDAVLFVVAVLLPTSWYLLAKAHSFVHTPMNYVLWYLLAISTLFWLIGRGALDAVAHWLSRLLVSSSSAPRAVTDTPTREWSDSASSSDLEARVPPDPVEHGPSSVEKMAAQG